MEILLILGIIFFLLGIVIRVLKGNNDNCQPQTEKLYYTYINNLMTKTEIDFYNLLEKLISNYELKIIPQIQLSKVFKTNNVKEFNKIRAKSIDFAITDEKFNYKFFIELDDYSHNRNDRILRDEFVNNLFKEHNVKLIRIKVSNNYNFEEIENYIKESLS